MIDFPASPTVGQQFTAAGVTWTWDGTKWTAAGLTGGPFLPLVGGTLTGNLGGTTASFSGNVSAAGFSGKLVSITGGGGGIPNSVAGYVGAGQRWNMLLGDGSSEGAGLVGSDFKLNRYNNSGTIIDAPILVARATGVVTIPDGLSAPQVIGDNRIINGDMRIDQRNGGASGTATAVYTVDRWQYNSNQASKGTWQRIGPAALGFPYGLGFTSSSAYASLAADVFGFYQPIEADMVSDFQWGGGSAQPVTLSFWAFSTLAGTFGGSVFNYPLPTTRTYPFTYILAANAWTKISLTIPGDTAGTWVQSGNAAALGVWFDLGSGTTFRAPPNAWAAGNYRAPTGTVSIVGTNGAVLFLTGVKLEIGNVATPFNRQSLAKSLADCQRYYSGLLQIYGAGSGQIAGQPFIHGSLSPILMRAAPTTVNLNTANNSNWTLVSVTSNNSSITANGNATAAGLVILNVLFALNAEL